MIYNSVALTRTMEEKLGVRPYSNRTCSISPKSSSIASIVRSKAGRLIRVAREKSASEQDLVQPHFVRVGKGEPYSSTHSRPRHISKALTEAFSSSLTCSRLRQSGGQSFPASMDEGCPWSPSKSYLNSRWYDPCRHQANCE